MMKLSKIEKIGQPPIFPDNDVETYFIPSSPSIKKNAIKNQKNIEILKTEIPSAPIIPKIELDDNLSFICEPIYKPSFFFSKKLESSKEGDEKGKEDENNNDNINNEVKEDEEENDEIQVEIETRKTKSTDTVGIRKRELEKKTKKKETIMKNSIKDLRNCYDISSSKNKLKKKGTKTLKKSNSSIYRSSVPSSSSTTVTRNSMNDTDKEEYRSNEKPSSRSSRGTTEKRKSSMKKPINYLRSNKSHINTKSRYLLSSSSQTNNNSKVKKEKSSNDDHKAKRKGKINVSLPLSLSIPYSTLRKGNKSSSKGQKVRSPGSNGERKNVSSKEKSESKKIKSIPLNISLSVTAPDINYSNDEEENENLVNQNAEEEGFDSSFCNNNFNNYDHNMMTGIQYCNPDNENDDRDKISKNNYIIENIIVNNENEQIFSTKPVDISFENNYEEEEEEEEESYDDRNSESEEELLRRDFFRNMGHNKMNYSNSETDKMYYYEVNENGEENINIDVKTNNNNTDDENKENKNINKRVINRNINNIIQKSKKDLLKKTRNNVDMWSIKSEPTEYSEKENKKSKNYRKSILKKTRKVNNSANNDEYNITYNIPPDYSMIPSSPPRSENITPSAPPSTYEEKYIEKSNITNEIMKETTNIARSIRSIKSLCSNNPNKNDIYNNGENANEFPLINDNILTRENDLNLINQNNEIYDTNMNAQKNTHNNNIKDNNNNIDTNNNNYNNYCHSYNNYEDNNSGFYNQQLLPQQPMMDNNNNQNDSNNIQNLQAAHLSLSNKRLQSLYHNKYMNNYNTNYIEDINNNSYQYCDNYSYNYRTYNNNNNNTNNNMCHIITINNDNYYDKNKSKHKNSNNNYNRHMNLNDNYESDPIPSNNNNEEIESLEDEPINIEYKRNYLTRNSTYLVYSAGKDDHIVKLRIPKLNPKNSYVPDTTSIRYNHPDLEKIKDVYNYFNGNHQPIEEPTNDNEFFHQLLIGIRKPKFSVTIVGYHPSSRINFNYYHDLSMGKDWKMECAHTSRFKIPTFKIQLNLENIVNDHWTELCVDNIYPYSSDVPSFNKVINNFVKSNKPIKKIELMTKVIFENRMEFETEIRKMFLSVGYYDKIEFIYNTSKSGVKIEKGKSFRDFNDNLCWTLCIWMYMWCIIWYPIMWCISGSELPPMIAYYQARVDMDLLRCIQPLILEGASQQDLFIVTI